MKKVCIPRSIRNKLLRLLAAVVVFCEFVSNRPAYGAIVTLSFSGTYVSLNSNQTVFGISGPVIPYNYQLTYDTSLNTITNEFFPAGGSLGGTVTGSVWYGYSKSGVVADSFTLGSKTWTVADLQTVVPAVGVEADLWFDTDINLATPTLTWFYFQTLGNTLQVGGAASDGGDIFLESISVVRQAPGFPVLSTDMTIQAVSEPAVVTMVLLGVLGALATCRRRA